jgi:amino acid adenylation domain-containing protein/non-ribosomal peptide synthase protein (TIGR01720 family)
MADLSQRLASLSPAKRALLKKLLDNGAPKQRQETISRRPADEPPALSFAQQRLWFLDQLEGPSATYNMPNAFRLFGDLNVEILESALAEIVRRHEALRTNFAQVDGKPVQVIHEDVRGYLSVVELPGLDSAQREEEILQRSRQDARRPFDLVHDRLLRIQILRFEPLCHVMLINMHHIVADGWSLGVIVREMVALYSALSRGEASPLPELPIQYADFAQWQRQWLAGPQLEAQIEYWQRQLAGAPSLLALPTDRPRPPLQTFRGSTRYFKIDGERLSALKALSRHSDASLFMVLLSGFATLLWRYSRQDSFVVGTPVANRGRKELEPLIGFFINTLGLRMDFSGDPDVRELIRRVKDTAMGAFRNQDVPFERLVEELQPARNLGFSPIFQVMFILQNAPLDDMRLPGVRLEEIEVEAGTSMFDMTFKLRERGGLLEGELEFNTDLFDRATIDRLIGHYQSILDGMCADPFGAVSRLPLLTEAERDLLVVRWNETERSVPESKTLVHLFEAQAALEPDRVAVVCGNTQLSYAALDERAERLAAYLQSIGIGPESPVGLCVPRSSEMVVGLMGILKSGGAYVPLDPAFPRERLALMAENAQLSVIVTTEETASLLPDCPAIRVFLDRDRNRITATAPSARRAIARPENLAYILYTSGSTGTPKGVQISHRALVNFLLSMRDEPGLTRTDVLLAVTTISFDIAALELFLPLVVGARVEIVSQETAADGFRLVDALRRSGANVMQATPATWQMLLATDWDGPPLQRIFCGGEALSHELASQLLAKGLELWNLYGPTETSIWSSAQRIESQDSSDAAEDAKESIGHPIANTQIYILDQQLQPVPVGVPGELFIAGEGVARGYYRRPDLTAGMFLPNPFGKPGTRMYKTGDLCRYRPDGRIEFIGRVDHQIKLRGFRVELGEIEAVIDGHPAVRNSVVMCREDQPGRQQLAAYLEYDPATGDPTDNHGALAEGQIDKWRTVWNQIYEKKVAEHDERFDTSGWISSYTGQPVPQDEMKAWVDETIARILALGPRRVMEIGCGTGMLLHRIAPHVEAFTGCDISNSVLARLQASVDHNGLKNVTLRRGDAASCVADQRHSFDTVILNSVIQYFPSVEYLLDVLDAALDAVADGGAIFLGDVRSLPLAQLFRGSVECYRASDECPREELVRRVAATAEREEELLIDPAFFGALRSRLPRLGQVDIQLKRHSAANEMSKFRYDVVLRSGPRAEVSCPDVFRKDAAEAEMDSDDLRLLLNQKRPHAILVQNVLNQRLVADIAVLQWLGDPSANGSVGEMRSRIASLPPAGIDPNEAWQMGEALGYSVSVSWSTVEPDRRFDVLFHRSDNGQLASSVHALATSENAVARPWKEYANDPVRSAGHRIVLSEVRKMLAARLPAYMIPASIVCLERFPLTPNGKINRAALPAPDFVAADDRYVAPRTDVEQQLAEIWTEVLDVPRVGVGDNFFELGGHSLLATQMISKIREKFSVELPIQCLFDAPKLGDLAARLASSGADQRPVLPPIVPVDRQTEAALPLSFAQRRLWFLDQLQGAHTTYNLFGAVQLNGDLKVAALEGAFREVVRRHEVLRTNFVARDGNPEIVVSPPGDFVFDIIHLENLADDSQSLEIDKWTEAEVRRPFDLARDRLFRAILLRRNSKTHMLLMSMHHIVSDEWSLGVLIHELSTLYAAFDQGQPSPLPELSIQYSDYAVWQRSWLADSVIKAQLEFWIERLSGAPARLELPTDRPRPKIQRHYGRLRSFHLERDLADRLESLGRGSEATLFMTLLTAYAILLHRYTGATDIVIGSPIANRVRRELESLVGFFVNTLPLRIDLSGNPSVRELLTRVRRTAIEAYSHQDVPFEQLVEELRPERNLGHAPIFQVMLVLQNAPVPDLGQTSLEISPVEPQAVAAKFDCTLSIEETANGLAGMIEYDTDLFDESTIDRMVGHFRNVLMSMIERPADLVGELNLLGEDERRRLLITLNQTRPPAPAQPTVTRLFETQARNTPDRPAVQVGDASIDYATLNDRANQLAAELRSFDVRPEVAVGIYLDRGMEAIASMLAILKTGGAYVPLDLSAPSDRLLHMIQETRMKVILTSRLLSLDLPQSTTQILCVDELPRSAATFANPIPAAAPENVAYIIYTSGSSGQPKGVTVTHDNLVCSITARLNYYDEPMPRLFSTLSFTFDAGNAAVFWALCQGGCLVIGPEDAALQTQTLVRRLAESRCSHLVTGPALYGSILDLAAAEQLTSLRTVVVGGEQLARSLAGRHAAIASQAALHNEYGPTEATMWSSVSRVALDSDEAPTIGSAVPGCRLYVLDRFLHPVPMGVPGELYIGGRQVARGYLDHPRMTADRFVPDPFSREPGRRLYRSGDLVKFRGNGELEFLGRADNQIKIRGFRIELGEIESALKEHAEIREAAVIVHADDSTGSKRLIAYCVGAGQGALQSADLRSYLKAKLPDYMVPATYMFVDELPLTANGKLDRRALPAVEIRDSFGGYTAPRTPTEQLLTGIWQEILGLDRVGIHDNFFELGGDSILSIQIISRVNRAGLGLTVKQLFEWQTIAELARVAPERRTIHAEQGMITGSVPLTPIQRWFFEVQPPAPHHCNHAVLLTTAAQLDPRITEESIHHLLLHHDELRSRFDLDDDCPRVEIKGGGFPIPFAVCNLTDLELTEARDALTADAERQQRSLHLTEGPLLRSVLYRMGHDEPDRLLLVIHHLVVDGVSWRILLEDFATVYGQLSRRQTVRLPEKTTSFRHWAERLHEYATAAEVSAESDYWRNVMSVPVMPLPRDHQRDQSHNTRESTDEVVVQLSTPMTQALLTSVPGAYHTQINDVLLTALTRCISNWTGEDTMRIVLEGHGREELFDDVDLSRTVGVFTSFFPVVLSRSAGDGDGDTLKRVKEKLRAVPHRGIRFGLLKYLNPDVGEGDPLKREPPAEISFNYLGRFDGESRSAVFSGLATESAGATQSSAGMRRYTLEINGILNESQLELNWNFSKNLHDRETISALAADFMRELERLIEHCSDARNGGYTASDFPLALPDDESLETLFRRWGRQVDDAYPLAPMQQGMLFHSLFEQNTGVDLIQLSCRIEGDLRPELFQQSWQQVLDRHPALRTAFLAGNGNDPLQLVLERVELPWQEFDWRGSSESQIERRLTDLLQADRLRGFTIDEPPLMRCVLTRLDANLYQFVWSHHHLLTDGWCLPILLNEAMAIYEGLLAEHHIRLDERRPFRDYIQWLARQDQDAAASFWRDNLNGFTSPTPLGVDHVSGAPDELRRFRNCALNLTSETTRSLQLLAQSRRLTLSVLVQGAWSLLLSRYSGSTDVVFGATVSGRPPEIADVDSMIGLFINTLPVRVQFFDEELIVDFLTRLQNEQAARDAFAHTPLVQIQTWSQVAAPDPLFESVVVFENYPMDESLGQVGGSFTVREFELFEQTNLPITLTTAPAESLPLKISYDSFRFDRGSIDRLLAHLGHLLESLVADPERTVAEWPMMPERERQQLLNDWNDTRRLAAAGGKTLAQLFETQVERTPARVAVVFGERTLTYEELNQRANQLARQLCEFGVRVGSRVGVFMERSLDMLIGLLAVNKTGAAYVPMDPMFPGDRLSHMLNDALVSLVLTQKDLLELVPKSTAQVFFFDGDSHRLSTFANGNLDVPTFAASPAYIIYTSGSTSKPKGVAVSGSALANLLLSMQQKPGLTEHDVLLAVTTISFDIAALELFLPLITGATIVIADRETVHDGAALLEEMRRTSATVMQATPVTWRLLLEAQWSGPPLTRALCGGEALPRELAARLLATGVELWNMYGPTETTIWSAVHQVKQDESAEANEPIGRPIDNTQFYIVDRQMRPVPVGVAGELLIGGDALAMGYVGRGGLTAEKFLPDPFGATPGGRIYQTGDLVRYRADGSLVFLGRLDSQVKVRGFRIELGEIEAALNDHPDVKESAVVARQASHGENDLIAYLITVSGTDIDVAALRESLGKTLPPYMMPLFFVFLSEFPLTPNGKVNRRALPAPDQPAQEKHVAPRTATEERLAEIWVDVFQFGSIGIDDSFFDLGGHSLLAAKVVGRIRTLLKVAVPIPLLFRQPTIRQISEFIDNNIWAAHQGLHPASETEKDSEEVTL